MALVVHKAGMRLVRVLSKTGASWWEISKTAGFVDQLLGPHQDKPEVFLTCGRGFCVSFSFLPFCSPLSEIGTRHLG